MIKTEAQLLNLDQLLNDFKNFVPAKAKRRALIQMGRAVVRANRARIRKQQNLTGGSFPKKKDGKRAITKILREKNSRGFRSTSMRQTSEESLEVIHNLPFALEHHKGIGRTVDWEEEKKKLADMRERRRLRDEFQTVEQSLGASAMNQPCTKEQARQIAENWDEIWQHTNIDDSARNKRRRKKLSEARVRLKNGRRWLALTTDKIQRMYTVGQAGYMLRSFKVGVGDLEGKKSWQIRLPERNVLGLSATDREALVVSLKKVIAQNSYFKVLSRSSENDRQIYESWYRNYIGG